MSKKTQSAGGALVALRWEKTSPEERSEAARKASEARWERYRAEHPEKAKKKAKAKRKKG